MKKLFSDEYQKGALILFVIAIIALLIAGLTHHNDITGAALVVSGIFCFITAILFFTLAKDEYTDIALASLLPVGGMIGRCRFLSDLGVEGNSLFFPPKLRNETITQLVPVTNIFIETFNSDYTYQIDKNAPGILVYPQGIPLLTHCIEKGGLNIPENENEVFIALRELFCEYLEIVHDFEINREGMSIIINLKNYLFIRGCIKVREESPKCCTMDPCPICSLILCILSQGLNEPLSLTNITISGKKNLEIVISCYKEYSASIPESVTSNPHESE